MVVGSDFAVPVQVGVHSFDGAACCAVVNLLVNLESVWSVACLIHHYGRRLHIAHICIGCVGLGGEAQVRNLVIKPCGVECGCPAPVLRFDNIGVQCNFNALGTDVAHICKHRFVKIDACGNGYSGKKVVGLARKVVNGAAEAVVQETEVDTEVPALRGFPAQVAVVCLGAQCRNPLAVEIIVGSLETLGIVGYIRIVRDAVLLTGYTVACTNLKVVHNRTDAFEEVLASYSPCKRYRRECAPPVCLGESRATVATESGGKEILAVESVVYASVVRQQRVALVVGRSHIGLFAGVVESWICGIVVAPVLVVVAHGRVEARADSVEVLVVVGIDGKKTVVVLLRSLLIVVAPGVVTLEGVLVHINRTFAVRVVVAPGNMQTQFGKRMQTVIYVHITYKTVYVRHIVVVHEHANGIGDGALPGMAGTVYNLVETAEFVGVVAVHRLCEVICASIPDGSAVGGAVMGVGSLPADVYAQMVVEETRRKVHIRRITGGIVGAQYTVLVHGAEADAERKPRGGASSYAYIIVRAESALEYLVVPVRVRCAEQRKLRRCAEGFHCAAELVYGKIRSIFRCV